MGGLISDNLSWHWIFFINLPVGIVCVLAAMRLLRVAETETISLRIDTVGLGLLILWIGALQLMLDLGHERDWFNSTSIVVLALTAAIGFVVFLIWELTDKHPVVDVKVFRHRGFAISVLNFVARLWRILWQYCTDSAVAANEPFLYRNVVRVFNCNDGLW